MVPKRDPTEVCIRGWFDTRGHSMFESFADEYEPTWNERLKVAFLFAVAALIAAAASAVLPLVDFRLQNIWRASLAAFTAALPLSKRFLVASRKSAYLTITTLSLLLCALGYFAFAVWPSDPPLSHLLGRLHRSTLAVGRINHVFGHSRHLVSLCSGDGVGWPHHRQASPA